MKKIFKLSETAFQMDGKMPLSQAIPLGLQHVLAMFVGNLTPLLIITHDISVAAECDRLLVLCGGRMLETGISSEVLAAPHHPYTKALLGALVENGMRETPALRTETGCCPFYRRCPSARTPCRTEMPQRKANGREWWCCAE